MCYSCVAVNATGEKCVLGLVYSTKKLWFCYKFTLDWLDDTQITTTNIYLYAFLGRSYGISHFCDESIFYFHSTANNIYKKHFQTFSAWSVVLQQFVK